MKNWFRKKEQKMCKKCGKEPVDHSVGWYCESCEMEMTQQAWLIESQTRREQERMKNRQKETDLRLKKKQEEALDLIIDYLKERMK